MKIIDWYIIRKFLGTFFFAIALIIVIVIIFDVSEKIDDFLRTDAPLSKILVNYYLNFVPYFVNMFSALFTFIAVIFFTSKMASNTEIIAILSSGVSFRRLLFPYIVSALVLALLSFVLYNFLIPPANKNRFEFESQYIRVSSEYRERDTHIQIQPGEYVYMETYTNVTNTGYMFSLERFNEEGDLVYKMLANTIQWDSIQNCWTISNYYVREIDGYKERLYGGVKLDTLFNLRPFDFTKEAENIEIMNFFELQKYIKAKKLKGADNIEFAYVEKHKRIAFPFATVILTIIGVALSSRKVRGGIGLHLGIGIGISFTFIMFMQITTTFATYSSLPAWIALWIPNVLFGILGIYLLKKAPK